MNYSLYKFFEEAQTEPIPDWFRHIELWFFSPETGKVEPGKPMWHQVTGLNLLMSHTRAALFDEMGTGKTAVAQAATLWHVDGGTRCVCLMPPILIKQFLNSYYSTFRGLSDTIRIETYHANAKKRAKQALRWRVEGAPHIVLTTYEMFVKESALFEEHKFDYIVADECKLYSSPTTNAFIVTETYLGKYGERGLCLLTGTPALNAPINLYGYIQLLTPWVYLSKNDFENQHVIYKQIKVSYNDRLTGSAKERYIDKIDAYMAKDIIFKHLYLQARRVEEKDVQELPPLNVIPVEVELSERHAAQYKKLVNERILLLSEGRLVDAVHSSSLRQKCAQAVLHPQDIGIDEVSANILMTEQLMDSIDVSQNKVLIFVYYQRTVELLRERWKKYNPAVIYGGQSGAANEKGRVKFLEDATCRLGIINYESGGYGLNFQFDCNHVICVETISIPGAWSQAMKRVHRGGQSKAVKAYLLMASKTIQVAQYKSMVEKQAEIDETVSRDRLQAELLGETAPEAVAVE